jgi:hypothetical protein
MKDYDRIHAEENKRRTLQRSDIATAISKTDMCDFLIDIVPREEVCTLPHFTLTPPIPMIILMHLFVATTVATRQHWV